MRKALMGMILAATVMTPIAAEAQRGHRGGDDRGGSTSRSSSGSNAESRAARIEARNEARQARSESAPQQQQQQAQPQPQQQVVQRQRGGDGDGRSNRSWRGNDNNQANNNRGNRGGGGDDGRRGRNTQSIYPQAWQGNPNDPRLRHYQQLERRNQQQGYRRGDNRGNDGNWRNNRNGGDTRRGDRRRGDWNRGWRSDRRYDWNGWRRGNRHRFHLSPYYSPYRNWNYSRFSIGFFLEPLFYNQRYWIGDPWQYRLPPAPYGTQWVRYYNDVLLVDIYTGEVIDTIYDFFW
jgi:hypothetical protein